MAVQFRVLAMCSCLSLLLGFSIAVAQVNRHSVFPEAREPASALDLKLLEIQTKWLIAYVISPNAERRQKHQLIVKTGVVLELNYSALYDRISATAWITNTDEFISLSAKERKQLVVNVLDLLWFSLLDVGVDDKKFSGPLKKPYIRLNVIISGVMETDKQQTVRLRLPNDIGIGQAGYKDGQFVYSESYFLDLQVIQGRAKSGDSTKFIIESEVKPK